MGVLEHREATGLGVEVYKWVVERLSLSKARGYRRLNAPVRRRVRLARLGKQPKATTTAACRLRLRCRLRLSWFSPFTLLAKLRDTYVNLLQAASNKVALSEGLSPFPGLPCEFGSSRFSTSGRAHNESKAKEREMDQILELYLARTRSQLLLTNSPC